MPLPSYYRVRLSLALLMPFLAFALQSHFWYVIHPYIWFLFYPAVFFSGWLGGRVGGIIATVLAAGLVKWFFMEPPHTLALANTMQAATLAVFIGMGFLFAYIHHRLQLTQAQAERMLAQMEVSLTGARAHADERLLAFIQQGIAGVAEVALDGRILNVNDRYCDIVGYPREELLGQPLQRFTTPEDWQAQQSMIEEMLRHGKPYLNIVEKQYRRKDGSLAYGNVWATLTRDAQGQPTNFIALVLDVTPQKQAELSLRTSEERLRLALNAAHLGIFDWDIANDQITWSDQHQALWGFQPGEFGGHYQDFASRVHPDDLAAVNAEVAHCLGAQTQYKQEFRVVWPDGSIHWIKSLGEFTYDTNGQAARMRGTVQDITERKQAEAALREAEAHQAAYHYTRNLIDVSLDPLLMISLDGKLTDANPATEAITGRSRNELIGTDFAAYFTEPLKAQTAFQQALTLGSAKDYLLEIQTHARQPTPVLFNASLYRNQTGDGEGVFAAARDITLLKQTESALREAKLSTEAANQRLNEQADLLTLTLNRLTLAADAADIGIWSLDLVADVLVWDKRMCEWYGVSESTGHYTHALWRWRVHPDDFNQTEAKLAAALNQQDRYEDEFRIVLPDGLIRHMHAAAIIERDVNGKPIRLIGINRNITEQKDMGVRLRESEQRYAYAMEASRDGIWDWDLQTHKIELTPSYFTLLGYAPHAFPETEAAWVNMIHPEDRERVVATELQLITSSRTFELEYRLRAKDGSYKWILSRGNVVQWDEAGLPWRIVGIITDVTLRKQLELELRNTNQELQAIFDSVGVGIALILNRVVVRCNRTLEDVFGYAPDEMNWMPTRQWFVDDAAYERLALDCYPTVNHGEIFMQKQPLLKKDGTVFLAKMVGQALDKTDPTKGILGVIEDITAEHEANEALRLAKNMAEIAVQTKSNFLANMSHEIRTPMNAIIGLSALVLDTDLNPHQRDYLGKVLSAAKSLLNLINDILDYSKIEAGHLHLEQAVFRLEDVVRNAADLFTLQLEDKGLPLIVQLNPDVPALLVGDSLRLGQVLNNLLGNAVKFTRQGEIYIKVEPVPPPAGQDATVTLRFCVCDTGIGITPEQVEQLFAPFTQADTSISRRFGGSGLGLSIAKRLVELMNGDISVTSTEGEGSQFTFTASFGKASQAAGMSLAETQRAGEPKGMQSHVRRAKPIQGADILLVEDNALNQTVAKAMLKKIKLNVTLAENGLEAVAWVAKQRFDAVLMDVHMPTMDGLEATRRIRQLPEGIHLPIIAMTASALLEERQVCLAAGMNGHVAKPVELELLLSCLLEWIPPRPSAVNAQGETAELGSPMEPGYASDGVELSPIIPSPTGGGLECNAVELAPNDNSRRAATLCRQQSGSGKSRHGDADLLLNSTALGLGWGQVESETSLPVDRPPPNTPFVLEGGTHSTPLPPPLQPEATALTVDRADLEALLEELGQALAQNLLKADKLASQLETHLAGTVLSPAFQPVIGLTRQMRFKAALTALSVFQDHSRQQD